MKNQLLKNISFLLVIILFVFIAGCDSTDNPVEPTDNPLAKPTDLKAFSKSSAEVGLTWVKSTDVTKAEFGTYVLKVKSGTTVVKTENPTKTDTSWTVSGLTEGTIYTFVLSSKTLKGTVGDSVTVTWSPAKRMDTDKDLVAIKLYEWNSTLPSGLDLQNSTGKAEVVPMSTSRKLDADVILDYTTTGNLLEFVSPKTRDASFKSIKFSTTTVSANSLDNSQATFPSESSFTIIESIFDNPATSSGKIVFAKTQENNYLRILVISKSGNLIQGSSPNRFVEVKISYQSTAAIPYAKKSK